MNNITSQPEGEKAVFSSICVSPYRLSCYLQRATHAMQLQPQRYVKDKHGANLKGGREVQKQKRKKKRKYINYKTTNKNSFSAQASLSFIR